jgi:diguanylate cyclase (GGDEF)-like protein
VLQDFAEIRQQWTLMIGAFRNMVANRSGIFDNPEVGMQGQMQNIANYRQRIDSLMSDLTKPDNTTRLGFIQEDALTEMREAARQWERGYLEATAILHTDSWRSDIPLLKSKVLPRFARLWRDIQILERQLDDSTLHDIRILTATADTLSRAIWLSALAGIVVIFGGYAFFRLTVLSPMSRVAAALDVEADGARGHPALQAGTKEARELITAFEKMRTRVRARHKKLDRLAHHDHLTGLPNRTLFRDRLEHALVRASRSGRIVGLLFIDLDRFKELNDTYGHMTGDRVLRAVATRLSHVVRGGDTVARLSGDEFTMILEGVEHARSAELVAQKVLQALASPFALDGKDVSISASIGIALYPRDGTDPDTLIKCADTAMYAAKSGGRDRYEFFDDRATGTAN